MNILHEDLAPPRRTARRLHTAKRHAHADAVFPALSTQMFTEASSCDAAEMTEMMRALNIDPVEAEFEYRRLYYGMEANCAGCRDKERCRADLSHDKAVDNFRDYCENAALLNEMRANPDVLRSQG